MTYFANILYLTSVHRVNSLYQYSPLTLWKNSFYQLLLACYASIPFQALHSWIISEEFKELFETCNKSIAFFLGTYKDQVSEKQIEDFDKQLQQSIQPTEFFSSGLVQFFSEQRMLFPIDNMNGGEGETDSLHSMLYEGMKKHFKPIDIPTAWLFLSLCLRNTARKTETFENVLQIAQEFEIPEKDINAALFFLHHYAGVLMYFPHVPELKDMVICDTQVVYDSATNLILNTFKFGPVGKAASGRRDSSPWKKSVMLLMRLLGNIFQFENLQSF